MSCCELTLTCGEALWPGGKSELKSQLLHWVGGLEQVTSTSSLLVPLPNHDACLGETDQKNALEA